ncbi:hypothetical protein GF352_02385 [archaeon]|nr:hypothetical protein [archaeon]
MIKALEFLKNKLYSNNKKIADNFHELNESEPGYVSAIDGGSCIIADGGCWVLAKIKTASVHYDKGERLPGKEKDEEVYYTVIKDKNEYSHSINTLKPEFNNVRELTEAPAVTMKTLELRHALKVMKSMPQGSLLLIDGLLKSDNEGQEALLERIKKESEKKGVTVMGLAKTFRHAVNGRSVIGSLIKERPSGKWYYEPVEDSDCLVVKLHAKSGYAYAVSSFSHSEAKKALPLLAYYSTDPALIGYPYPLLKVDRDARVSSHEKHLEKNRLRIICKKNKLDFIEYDEKSTDMHSLIDKQKYR